MRVSSHAAGLAPAALAFLLFGACPATPPPLEARRLNIELQVPTYQLNLYMGGRDVDKDEFLDDLGNSIDLSEQGTVGLEFSEILHNTFGWELGLFYSHGDDEAAGRDYDFVSYEVLLGGRYTYTGIAPFLPYVGIGGQYLIADVDRFEPGDAMDPTNNPRVETDDGSDLAMYAHAGFNLLFGSHFLVGLNGRATFFSGDDLEYLQAALTVGWAF